MLVWFCGGLLVCLWFVLGCWFGFRVCVALASGLRVLVVGC